VALAGAADLPSAPAAAAVRGDAVAVIGQPGDYTPTASSPTTSPGTCRPA
jgi:hypothetical protein